MRLEKKSFAKKKCKYGIFIILGIFLSLMGLLDGKMSIHAAENTSIDGNENNMLSLTYVNPIYSDTITKEYIEQQVINSPSLASEMEYSPSVSEAAKILREQLKKRTETIEVGVFTKTLPTSQMIHEIFDESVKHTGVANEGDYLMWQYAGWAASMSYCQDWSSSSGYSYRVHIIYNMHYITNSEQEKEMDSAVSNTIKQLKLGGKNDYEKIVSIYDYMCKNISYDYENLNDNSYMLKYSAYAALINKKSVCQGYANLFYRLALEVGIDTRVVVGTGNGGAHAWNIVKIDGKYYNLDATWDAGRNSYAYFLKGTENFSDHVVGIDSADIKENYKISNTDFNSESLNKIPDVVSGLKIGGRATDALRLNWNKNNNASGYIIEQYKNGKWTRIARIGSNSTTTYRVEKLSASTTYKFRVQSFDFNGTTPLYSSWKYIDGKTLPTTVSGLKIGGRATDALRLNWNKNSNASGYIIEQYKNGKWTRIARIGSNSTTTYRVEKLSASTTYKFRVQSFDFNGTTPLYSSWKYIDGKTLPTTVSGLKIGGRATDALRLNWNKNSNASGYIIEQYKNGKWTRIARIGSNSTTTYRVERLSKSTTYKFRVQSFDFDGTTAIYSSWQYVEGVTK